MKNFFNKMKYGLARWLYGRYGWDAFGAVLFTIALILDIVSLFVNSTWLSLIATALLIYELFRMYSKNITARRKENDWLMRHTRKLRHHFSAVSRSRKDKTNRYYVCPQCGQIVRIPKGHGKVEISCPKCHHQFTRKS